MENQELKKELEKMQKKMKILEIEIKNRDEMIKLHKK